MRPAILLRTKILLGITGVVFMVSIAGLLVIHMTVAPAFRDELYQKAISLAAHTSTQAVNPLLTRNTFELEMLVRDIRHSDRDIAYIFILDSNGKDVLAHTFEKEFPQTLVSGNPPNPKTAYTIEHLSHKGEAVIDIAMPVLEGTVGTLRMGVSEKSISSSVRRVTRAFILVIFGVSSVAIVLGVLFSRAITRPITELTEAAQDVIDGNADRRVSVASRDEIGFLASTINAMLTSRKRIDEELTLSEERYRALVESTEDSIYLVDRDYCYLFMNRCHMERMGFGSESYLGRLYADLHSPEETAAFTAIVDTVFETGQSSKQEHLSGRDNRFFLRTFSPMRDKDGTIIAVNVVSKDITDLKVLEEKLTSLSLTDELTSLYNRRGFFTLVDQQIKIANRAGEGIYMIYADLDNLKEINDRHGHSEGDRALVDIAKIFQDTFRESDIIARIGGDEFVIIPAGTNREILDSMRERFEKRLEAFNAQGLRPYRLSVSIGIAHYDPSSPVSVDDLLMEADRSMYEVKRLKRQP